jgi:cytochrome b561
MLIYDVSMISTDSSFKYTRPLIGLHWLMFLLFIVVYAAMEFRVIYDKGMPERDFMKSLHFMFGLCILLLVVFRLWAKRLSPRPALLQLHGLANLMHRASGAAHVVLYVFMILMPLMGWVMLSAAGKPIPFFGLELPALIPPDEALAKQIKSAHALAGNMGYGLIGLHVGAALFHQWVLKDRLLQRMVWR